MAERLCSELVNTFKSLTTVVLMGERPLSIIACSGSSSRRSFLESITVEIMRCNCIAATVLLILAGVGNQGNMREWWSEPASSLLKMLINERIFFGSSENSRHIVILAARVKISWGYFQSTVTFNRRDWSYLVEALECVFFSVSSPHFKRLQSIFDQ